jgi:hypothetical protein
VLSQINDAVFFIDPYTGNHFELSQTPWLPAISNNFAWINALKPILEQNSAWSAPPENLLSIV